MNIKNTLSIFRLKTGQTDINSVLIFIFMLAFSILVGYLLLSNFNTNVQSTTMSTESKTLLQDRTDDFPSVWDNAFIVIFISLALGLLLSGYLIDTYPVFFVVNLLLLLFSIVLAAVISNTFYAIESSGAFVFAESVFPKMHYVMNHLAHLVVVMGFLFVIGLYAKVRE